MVAKHIRRYFSRRHLSLDYHLAEIAATGPGLYYLFSAHTHPNETTHPDHRIGLNFVQNLQNWRFDGLMMVENVKCNQRKCSRNNIHQLPSLPLPSLLSLTIKNFLSLSQV